MARLTRYAADRDSSIWGVLTGATGSTADAGITPAARRKLDEFTRMISGFAAMQNVGADAMSLAQSIIDQSRLMAVLMSDRTPESISKQENLSELLAGVKQFADQKQEEGYAIKPPWPTSWPKCLSPPIRTATILQAKTG